MNVHEFLRLLDEPELLCLREVLEIGEMRMWDEISDEDEWFADLRLDATLNDWPSRQLTLALLSGYDFVESDCCRDHFRLTDLGQELLEAMREGDEAGETAPNGTRLN